MGQTTLDVEAVNLTLDNIADYGVCGAPRSSVFGKPFYQTGRSKFGAPLCKEHTAHTKEYANPVLENRTAQNLYKYMHPQIYQKKSRRQTDTIF